MKFTYCMICPLNGTVVFFFFFLDLYFYAIKTRVNFRTLLALQKEGLFCLAVTSLLPHSCPKPWP